MNPISLIKKRGIRALFYKLKASIFPKDEYIKSLCAREGAYEYLLKYEPLLDSYQHKESDDDNNPPTIWVCWLQGIENAPLLVQKCVESLKRFSGNMNVVILDNTNITDYIDIPSHISQKYKQGIISHTFYSDYVRIAILKKHGGLWIDSTTYLTGEIPSYITDAPLFCFKQMPIGKVSASNWFIGAKKGNPIVGQLEYLLNEYWRREDKLVSYSIFHLFLTMIINHNEKNRQLWKEVPYFEDANCKVMQQELFDQYSETRFKQLCGISSIHKLTYKFSKKADEIANTYYQHIIGHNL